MEYEAIWTPDGTAAETTAVKALAAGDRVLVHKSYGTWGPSTLTHTQRHSVWGEVTLASQRGSRAIVTVVVGDETFEIADRHGDGYQVARQAVATAQVSTPPTRAEVIGLSNRVLVALSAHGTELFQAGTGDAEAHERAHHWGMEARKALRELVELIPTRTV